MLKIYRYSLCTNCVDFFVKNSGLKVAESRLKNNCLEDNQLLYVMYIA